MADYYNLNVTSSSNLSANQLNAYINPRARNKAIEKKVPNSVMENIGSLLLKMEKMYGINAAFLAAVAALESAWGTSNYARNYYSLFGVGAYNQDPDSTIGTGGGSSLEEGVNKSVSKIKQYYIDKGKTTINKIQAIPGAYAVLNNGSPNPEWSMTVSTVWKAIMDASGVSPEAPSPSNPPKKTPTRQQQWYIYNVVSGDTLSFIATKFKTTTDFIKKWNGLQDTNKINASMPLKVYPYYEVVNGDTLTHIANDFGTSVNTLLSLNPFIKNKDLIYPSQKIRLPDAAIQTKPPKPPQESTPSTSEGTQDAVDTKVAGGSPSVYDDIYPKHRYSDNPFFLRIGDSQFFIPPVNIKTDKTSNVNSVFTLRSKAPTQTKSGFSFQKVTIELVIGDVDHINGYKIEGPKGQIYYMDGLRSLLAQFYKTPFLPIRNELLNNHYGIYNVALSNIVISTIQDIPNALEVILEFYEFNQEMYTQMPNFFYDNLIMYPLFRWWYQQQLLDDAAERLSATYLRPVTERSMLNDIELRVLDKEKLEDKFKEKTIHELSKLKMADLSEFMTEWDLGDISIQNIKIGISKELTPLQADDQEMPIFQDFGGTQRDIQMDIICSDRAQLESINQLSAYLEDMSREYRHRFVSGFLQINNDLINMVGIYSAMIVGVQTSTMSLEEIDNAFTVRIILRAFEPTQKSNERLFGVNSLVHDPSDFFDKSNYVIEDKLNMTHELIYETQMEKALRFLELYPDLELPTYDDVNEIIPIINSYRKSKGFSSLPINKLNPNPEAVFVDPDFYFAYPDIQQVFEHLEVGDMGYEFVNLLNFGTSTDSVMNEAKMAFGDILDVGSNVKTFENWQDEDFVNVQKITANQSLNVKKIPKVKTVPLEHTWGESSPVPQDQDLLDMMTYDMVHYNKRSRMVRAFPTYLLLFIDEGKWLNGRRLWNNYYAYHAIHRIDVVKDKENPVDLAYIDLSNIYGAFDVQTGIADPKNYSNTHKTLSERLTSLVKDINITWTDKEEKERTKLLEYANLQQGARVHIRLGYGSSASGLPITFNGKIAEVLEGDNVQIVCQGDGAELVNRIVGYEPGDTAPAEPRNMFAKYLGERNSSFLFNMLDTSDFFNNLDSAYGIEHFGIVESEASEGILGTTADLFSYPFKSIAGEEYKTNLQDVLKNIYLGKADPTTDSGSGWTNMDGESNINIGTYGKTAWDIFTAHTLFNAEFILGIHPHGFRSTLFFGMPHWMVKYRYHFDAPANGNIENKNLYKELAKPYQQFHVLSSGYDLIHNGITATDEKMAHVAVGVYAKGAGGDISSSFAVYADRSIKQSLQKSVLIDTGVVQNLWGPDWIYNQLGQSLLGTVMDAVGDIGEAIGTLINYIPGLKKEDKDDLNAVEHATDWWREHLDSESIFRPGEVQARTVAIGALQRKFSEMYQGEMITLGNPSLKPWDIFYLNDTHNIIAGTAQVGKVTHSIGRDTGFISIVKPDLITTRADGLQRNALIQMLTVAGSKVAIDLGRKLAASKVASSIAKATGKGTVGGLKGLATAGSKLLSLYKGAGLKGMTKVLGGAVRAGTTAVKAFGISSAAAATTKGIMGLIKGNLLTLALTGFLTTWVNDLYRKYVLFNNVLYAFPLWKSGKPYAAGIAAGRYIIPNYIDPEYVDENTMNEIKNSIPNAMNLDVQGSNVSRKIRHPLDYINITSKYGPRWGTLHRGTDFAPDPSKSTFKTPVYAIADGTVIINRYQKDGAGNYVAISHNINGTPYVSVYMHLKTKSTASGKVKKGQIIGYMGNTGNVVFQGNRPDAQQLKEGKGTHLHFEIHKSTGFNGNAAMDPEAFFASQGIPLSTTIR